MSSLEPANKSAILSGFNEDIAHICEIRGDKAGAIAAYREQLRLMREDWGIVSGEECEAVERAIQRLR